MMNRSVLERQMFAKGGAAFPDLSGDGKVTRKDILMGRGVIPMQEGGMAMAPEAAGIASMANAAPPAPEMEAMGAQSVDPAVLEGMLAQAGASGIGDLEQAEDYEQMINMMRGDQATIPERREELAELVGPEDAAQTPESVLALVQPIVQIAAVDEGIGGLAQEQMTESVEGPMAEGIMSTMAPAPAPAAPGPMMEAGSPPPVNFNQGGLVRRGDNQPVKYFANGGVDFEALLPYMGPRVGTTPTQQSALRSQVDAAMAPPPASTVADLYGISVPKLEDAFKARQESYRQLLGDATSPEELERQKKMTQAQMLFDIAQTALTFAGPMKDERSGMSAAERLAMAASSTKLPQTLGARAQQQLEYEKAAKKEERATDLAALTAAEAEVTAAKKAERDIKLALAKKDEETKATKPFTTTRAVTIDGKQYAPNVLVNLQPKQVAQVDPDALKPYEKPGEGSAYKAYEVTSPIIFKGVEVDKGQVLNITSDQAAQIEGFETSTIPYKAADKTLAAKPIEVRDKDGNITQRLDLSLPADRKAFLSLPDDVTTHTIGTYNKDAPKSAVWKEIREMDSGKLLSIVDTNTEEGAAAVADAPSKGYAAYNIGTYSEDKPDSSTKLVVSTKPVTVRGSTIQTGTPMYLTDDEISAIKTEAGADALRNYEKPDKPPAVFGSGSADKALQYFATGMVGEQRALDAYAAGAQDDIMESMISNYTAPVVDARGVMQKRQLPDFVKQAIKQRLLANPSLTSPVPLNTLGLTTQEMQTIRPTQDLPLLNPDNTVNLERATSDPTFIITGLDYTRSQGFASSLNRFFNVVAGHAGELGLGPGYAGNTGKITSAADKQLNALARQTISVARNAVDGRVFALDLELLRDEVNGFTPGGVRTDLGALQQLRVVRQTLASQYSRAKNIVDSAAADPGAFDAKTVQAAKLAMMDTERLIAEYTAAILAYEANIPGRGSATSVTGGLPRVGNP